MVIREAGAGKKKDKVDGKETAVKGGNPPRNSLLQPVRYDTSRFPTMVKKQGEKSRGERCGRDEEGEDF